jgi:hypothetical protein
MSGIAVKVAVIQENKILLTKREDFETWILPMFDQAEVREKVEVVGG